MSDQSQMLNQSQMMNQPQMLNQSNMMNQSQRLSQSLIMNQNQPQMMNQPPQMMNQNQPHQLMNQNQPQMMNRSYGLWLQQPSKSSMDSMKFPNPLKPTFTASKPSMPGRSNWKGKKGIDKRKDLRRNEQQKQIPVANTGINGVARGGVGGYKPPTLHELQSQNRLKARRFYHPKKKFNNRFAPYAPRNTTSFIIRAKKSGGIASLVSPCPVTPAVLPTPIFSPSREVLGDMAKEEWGVDGYGSMNGLIRLRSPGNEVEGHEEEEEEEEEGGSSESDVEEHVEVERRLDHDLSRFEMIYPNCGVEYNNVLGNRVDDQDTHITQLEEENLTLKERLFLMERELGDLRRRLQCLERQSQMEDVNEEVVENGSENESESGGRGEVHAQDGENNEEVVEYAAGNEGGRDVDAKEKNEEVVEHVCGNEGGRDVDAKEKNEEVVEHVCGNEGGRGVDVKEENNDEASENEGVGDVCMEEFVIAPEEELMAEEDEDKDEEAGNACLEKSIGDGDLSNCPALIRCAK